MDMAAHFQKTAADLQKTIDEIKAAVEKGYQEKTLTETVRGDFQSQIDAAAMAVGKYQDDATAAMARYDVVNTAIKDYKGALATLRATVGTKTLVVATPATEVTGKTYGERITQLQTEIDRVAGNFSGARRSSMPTFLPLCWPCNSRRPSSPTPRPSMLPSPMTRSIPTRLPR